MCTKVSPTLNKRALIQNIKKKSAISIKTWCNSKMAPTADRAAHAHRMSGFPVYSRPKSVRDNPGGKSYIKFYGSARSPPGSAHLRWKVKIF